MLLELNCFSAFKLTHIPENEDQENKIKKKWPNSADTTATYLYVNAPMLASPLSDSGSLWDTSKYTGSVTLQKRTHIFANLLVPETQQYVRMSEFLSYIFIFKLSTSRQKA